MKYNNAKSKLYNNNIIKNNNIIIALIIYVF